MQERMYKVKLYKSDLTWDWKNHFELKQMQERKYKAKLIFEFDSRLTQTQYSTKWTNKETNAGVHE